MKTLEHQLTALGTHLDEGHRPIGSDEVLSGRFETATSSEPRSRWWVAVVAAAAVLALIGGTTWILGGDAPEVADESTVTTVAPSVTATTIAAPLPTGPVNPAAYADVPSFYGTVTYFQHDPALGSPGWQATVSVRFAEPMRFMYTVVEERPGDGDSLFLGGPGTIFIGDGTQIWLDEADDLPPLQTQQRGLFRHLFYDSESPSPAWDEICGASPERIGVETIAGRPTSHIACSTALEDYELWIDEESGVVLKMRGPLFVGDLHPQVDRDGGFEFTEFAIAGVSIPEVKIPQVEIAGVFPPHHMIRTNDPGSHGASTVEYWYLDDGTLRQTVIAGSGPEIAVGLFTVAADGQISTCDPNGYEGACTTQTVEHDGDYFIPLPSDEVPIELVGDHCDELPDDTIAGRTAKHFSCSGVWFEHRGYWFAGTDPQEPDSEYWFDLGTGLAVGFANDFWSWQVDLLGVNPTFPEGIFEHDLPTLTKNPYVLGDGIVNAIVPAWSGPLIDGTMVNLEEFRRPPDQPGPVPGTSFVVVYDWFPTCGPICLEGIADFQTLYEKYGTTDWDAATGGYSIEFLSVVEDVVSVAQRTNERLGITVPTVSCFIEEGAHDQIDVCTPENPWNLWGNALPSWTVMDTGGFFVYGVTGRDYDFAALDSLLAEISG
ncbi:MAG: hypothetical protein JRE73_14120 [Deltaproteobacteria bacterium]|nr:hypothetical protein [Deltaproteobacteria bacterium]